MEGLVNISRVTLPPEVPLTITCPSSASIRPGSFPSVGVVVAVAGVVVDGVDGGGGREGSGGGNRIT